VVDYMKISRHYGIWETVAECEGCNGSGSRDQDYHVIDHDHGGYIGTRFADCSDCEGSGWRHLTEAEEEQLYALPCLQ